MLQRKSRRSLLPGQPENVSTSTSCMVRALIASFVVPRATSCGIWARRAPVPILPPIWPSSHQLPDMHRYDWVVDNLNIHWSLDVCRLVAQWCKEPFVVNSLCQGVQRRAFLSAPSISMSSILRPNMAPGSIKWSCGFVSWPVAFSSEAISVQLMISTLVCLSIWKSTILITPIRIAGRIRGSPWCARHLSVRRVVSNVRGGRG